MRRFVIGFAAVFVAWIASSVQGQEFLYYPTTTYYAPATYYSPVVTTAYYAPAAPATVFYLAPTTVYYGATPVVMNSYRPLVGNITRVRYAPVTVAYPTAPTTVFYRY